jgi:transcriptional regulator with XRE-family HTH domain
MARYEIGTDGPAITWKQDHSMDAGQKLKSVRERLGLRYRDVLEASLRLAEKHQSDEYMIALSRLSDIENKRTVPTIFRLYSLCTIYRLDYAEVLEWYGVRLTEMPADASRIDIERTHLLGFGSSALGEVQFPLALDPGIDMRRTTFLSRMVQRWGRLPLAILDGLDLKNHRYGYIGTEDWTMYPLLHPGSLVLIDESHHKIVNSGWTNEFERPIYFLEHREKYICSWCTLSEDRLVVQPHPASLCLPEVFEVSEVDVIGQVTGVAMRLDPTRRRRVRV